MKIFFQIAVWTGLLVLLAISPTSAKAEEGLPGSPDFGYGACLDLEGYHIETAIKIANNYGLDWLTIDFDWAYYWSNPDAPPQWDALDRVMAQIQSTNLAVMISITNAPHWAIDALGPNIDSTANLTLELVQRYPGNILAIELFPSANTFSGWGASPNPHAYAKLLEAVQFTLADHGFYQTIIAAGIDPSSNRDEALRFLQGLYATEISVPLPVVSLRIPAITHSPETYENEVSEYTLKFYENARNVMLNNDQQNGLLWVTRFDWNPDQFADANDQAVWLQQAYLTMRSQLYIGVASFYCLNDPSTSTSLISPNGNPTMVFNALGELIAAENNGISVTQIIPTKESASEQDTQPTSP